ncbi:divalent-cation tolerance protein CutA [uncultured Parvibaculum sp.]|mgnify:CR=1 FL=1|uniref:divalent-cation tolerance protein CutA n=1 Tax=uncultured Parvibaculum sp. TaxID=291828 RepID=UPI0030EC41CB|tara:strand:- start:19189 stop:19527 length:339 start_codon:yes stop_codon:yes gene_type:complete
MSADTQEGEFVFVYTTLPSAAAAETLGRALVEARLAACVNIHPGLRPVYEWGEEVVVEDEAAVFIKTRAVLADAVMATARKLHPYEVPALLVLPILQGNADYLDWARRQTKG